MPFKIGAVPIRRTKEYLEAGKLVFKDRVSILTVNYNDSGKAHKGAQDFIFWNLNQIQYANPKLQITTFVNLTPSPFITCYLNNGEKVYFDVDSQSNSRILERLIQILGKSEKQLEMEAIASAKKDNPANFGEKCERFCICSQAGQLPCPSLIPVPKHWRGKYTNQKFEDEESC